MKNKLFNRELDFVLEELSVKSQLNKVPVGDREKAWSPGEVVVTGGESEVGLEIGPEVEDEFIFHTHPKGSLPIPSFQDLVSAIRARLVLNAKGSAIISLGDDGRKVYVSIIPSDVLLSKFSKDMDEKVIAGKLGSLRGDLEKVGSGDVLGVIEKAGFKVDSNLE